MAVQQPPAATSHSSAVPVESGPPGPAYRAFERRSAAGLTLEEGFDQLADAIRDPTRRHILVEFYRDPSPRTASDVADQMEISRPVARAHLEVLRATGFLRAEPRRGRRGKPAHLYALDTSTPRWMPHPPRQMALLSLLVLEAASLPPERIPGLIEQVGFDYGMAIAELRRPLEPGRDFVSDVTQAIAPLSVLGVALQVDQEAHGSRQVDLTIHDPIFREACPERLDLVCRLHVGIVRALIRDVPYSAEVTPIDGGVEGGMCRVAVRMRPARRVAQAG